MAGGDDPEVCQVAVLAAHPSELCVLAGAADDPEAQADLVLPLVKVSVEPTTDEVVTAVSAALGVEVLPLRTASVRWTDRFDTTAMVVEVAPLQAAPDGYRWLSPASGSGRVVPEWAGDALAELVREREHGWSPLRPEWERPGWYDEAAGWMRERMVAAGMTGPGRPRVHHLWGVSVVLAADSRDGRAFLKCSAARFRHEAVLTQALARSAGEVLPEVLDVDALSGWLLMRDFRGTELGELPEASWTPGLTTMAHLQHVWAGRTQELLAIGAEPRPLEALSSWVGSLGSDEAWLDRLDAPTRTAWLAAVPQLVDACGRLDELGPPPTLVHGDLHPWNVVAGAGSVRVFDWTDAAVSHPFLDLVTYVTRAEAEATRRQLCDAYLACWADHMSPVDLAEAGRLALVVGSLYQVRTYTELLPTLLPADLGGLADGDLDWAQRAVKLLATSATDA